MEGSFSLNIEAMTLKLRLRSFSHKSRYLSHLMRYQHPVWWLGKPEAKDILWRYDRLTLPSMSRSHFNRNWKKFDFLVLTAIFALSLLGIVITGTKWCRNIKRLKGGHHVIFKFGDGIFIDFRIFCRFHMLALNWRFYSHSPGGATYRTTIWNYIA
jgi:hypothetical protein